jgi:hypothetical protein
MDVRKAGAIAAAMTAAILLLATAGSASAATRNTCPGMTLATSFTTTTHFYIHYSGAISAPQATQLGADAEAGYALETTQLGFPPALNDAGVTPNTVNPDGRTDVFVYPDDGCSATPGQTCGCSGFMQPDAGSNTGWVYIAPGAVANHSTMPHEYFHAIQLGINRHALDFDVLREASASWIGALASNTDGGHPPIWQRQFGIGQTLDAPNSGAELPYGNWPFFEYESERWSPAVIKETFQQSASGGAQTTWMNAALAARSASLGQAVTEYANQTVAADWPLALLRGQFPLFQSNAILGVSTNTSTTQTASLDHLATRYFKLQSNACQGTCEATLHMDLGWPNGSGIQAALVKLGSSPGQRMQLSSGATGAHADLPFNLGTQYGVAITNPSLSADSVPVSLNANATTPPASTGTTTKTTTTTAPPPPPPPPPGPPTIQFTIKPRVTHSGRTRTLRFTLDSSDAGFVVVTLTPGTAKLAAHTAAKATASSRTLAVKQGTFTYRIPLSKRVAKGRYTVTLTPQSTTGTTGTPISGGKISVPKVPKAKKKAKRATYIK